MRVIASAFSNYVNARYRGLVDNWENNDAISQTPVAWIPRQLLVVVPTDEKRYGFNSMDLIRWMIRKPTNPCSREIIPPEIGWRCIEIAERFIKLEHKRLAIQKRDKRHMNIWKCEQAQLQEMQGIIDRFEIKHYHRDMKRKRQETFLQKVEEARPVLLESINQIRSGTVMNRITAKIVHNRVQSLNYQCTVTHMKEKPVRKLIHLMEELMEPLANEDADSYTSTSSDSYTEMDADEDTDESFEGFSGYSSDGHECATMTDDDEDGDVQELSGVHSDCDSEGEPGGLITSDDDDDDIVSLSVTIDGPVQ